MRSEETCRCDVSIVDLTWHRETEDNDEHAVGNATKQTIHHSVATAGKSTSTSSAKGSREDVWGIMSSTDTEPDRIESGQGESQQTQRRKVKKKRKEEAQKGRKRGTYAGEWQTSAASDSGSRLCI
jgi:hypothetical protein